MLAAAGTKQVRVQTQRLREARAEPVRLHQHRHQRTDIVDAGAMREVHERIGSRFAGTNFRRDEGKLIPDGLVSQSKFLAALQYPLVEAAAGLEAYDQEVDGVGQSVADHPRPLAD